LEEGGFIRGLGIERPSFRDLVRGKTFRNVSSVVRLGVLFVIILITLVSFHTFLKDAVTTSRLETSEAKLPRAYSGNLHRMKILKAVEIYRLEKGKYPKDLQQLVSSGILANWDLVSEGGQPYRFKVAGDGRISLNP
jgi:hypothetical protein